MLDYVMAGFTKVPDEEIDSRDLTGQEKLVLVIMRRFADNTTGQCYPSARKIAELSGLSKRKVYQIIGSLPEKKRISKQPRFVSGSQERDSNLYTLLGGECDTPRSEHSSPHVVNEVHQGSEHSAQELDSRNYTHRNYTADALIDYLNTKTGKHFRHSESSRKPIRARLHEGFTSDELKQVVDRKSSQWLNDEKMRAYLRPQTLFQASKFESYLNEVPAKTSTYNIHQNRFLPEDEETPTVLSFEEEQPEVGHDGRSAPETTGSTESSGGDDVKVSGVSGLSGGSEKDTPLRGGSGARSGHFGRESDDSSDATSDEEEEGELL
jgi:uncharacterized phage protein (TIGR02220 family)